MLHISLRVTEEERSAMENYAKMQGLSVSEAIKNVFFQKLEDELDLQKSENQVKKKVMGEEELYSLEDAKTKLGIN